MTAHHLIETLVGALGEQPDVFVGESPHEPRVPVRGELELRYRPSMTDQQCTHLDTVAEVSPSSTGCEDCLLIGGTWLNLRMCMSCGHVGCCDSSPNRHASAHFLTSSHPLIRSYEPGQDWWWCYVDEVAFEVEGAPAAPSHP